MPVAFAVVKDAARIATPELRAALEKEVMKTVDGSLGAIARPKRVHFVTGLPKTRSGKLLRRSIQALAEGRDPGDLTTIDDPSTLEQIKNRWQADADFVPARNLPVKAGQVFLRRRKRTDNDRRC